MASKSQILANTKYAAKNYDRILLRLRKDGETTREKIQNAAAAAGESVNEFILNAVREKMNQGPTATGATDPEKENPAALPDQLEENPAADNPEPVRVPFIEDP